MEMNDAVDALAALGHAKRLAIFRLLVVAGSAGRMAGDIGDELGMPGATLSFHLKELLRTGLITAEPQGRFICYRAAFDAMAGLIAYLTHNCCADEAGADCVPASVSCAPGNTCC